MSYFGDLSPEGKQALRDEFESKTVTQDRRIEILGYLRDAANEVQVNPPCPMCGHAPFFAAHDRALIEGHVYSMDGINEIRITGYCEYCFDSVAREMDE